MASTKERGAIKLIAENRKARHEYEVLEKLEAGLVLLGSEVKSLRDGKGNIAEAHVRVENGEVWLINAHIAQYPQAGPHNNHAPRRPRKMLLKVREIERLQRKVAEKGLTAVPLKLFFKGAWVKVEVAVGRGRKLHDKRQAIKERDDKRHADRALRRH